MEENKKTRRLPPELQRYDGAMTDLEGSLQGVEQQLNQLRRTLEDTAFHRELPTASAPASLAPDSQTMPPEMAAEAKSASKAAALAGWTQQLAGVFYGPQPLPAIPALALGRVLPENHSFAAATQTMPPAQPEIETLDGLLDEQTQAILAGFQTTATLQRELLEAVLQLDLGDEPIGRAAARYTEKMTKINGGL